MNHHLLTVTSLLADQLSIEESAITPDAILADLGADSLDIIELVMALEEQFQIEIPDADTTAFTTAAAIADYLTTKVPATSTVESLKANKWKPFFFESNQFFDTIQGPEDWARLKAAYPDMSDEQLLDSKEATYSGNRKQEERDAHPNYGLRWEHDGERTLREFFKTNGMSLPTNHCPTH